MSMGRIVAPRNVECDFVTTGLPTRECLTSQNCLNRTYAFYTVLVEWEVIAHPEVERWINELDASSQIQLVAALRILREEGPSLGRPLVDRIKGSVIHNLKELRPGSKGLSEIRVLFVFDRDRQAILLVGGDKQNRWSRWYKSAIPLAQERYEQYLN